MATPESGRIAQLKRVSEPSLTSALVKLEQVQLSRRCKFGAVLVRHGQTDENEIFANAMVPSFERFMDLLADRVQLRGWQRFAGGLNTVDDSTGTHAYFTEYEGFEVMFHTAPLLPYQPRDVQQVERKRCVFAKKLSVGVIDFSAS